MPVIKTEKSTKIKQSEFLIIQHFFSNRLKNIYDKLKVILLIVKNSLAKAEINVNFRPIDFISKLREIQ